jgi:hypothetical protein
MFGGVLCVVVLGPKLLVPTLARGFCLVKWMELYESSSDAY